MSSEYISARPEVTEEVELELRNALEASFNLAFRVLCLALVVASMFLLLDLETIARWLADSAGPLFGGAFILFLVWVFAEVFMEEIVEENPTYQRLVMGLVRAWLGVKNTVRREYRLQWTRVAEEVPVALTVEPESGEVRWVVLEDEGRVLERETSWEPFAETSDGLVEGRLSFDQEGAALHLSRSPDSGGVQLELRDVRGDQGRLVLVLDDELVEAGQRERLPELRYASTVELEDGRGLVTALVTAAELAGVAFPRELERHAQEVPVVVGRGVKRGG